MTHRVALIQAIQAVMAARREYQTELDDARAVQLAANEPVTDEQVTQTLGALVRQLDNAGRELGDAIRTIDQRERVIARQSSTRPPNRAVGPGLVDVDVPAPDPPA